MKKLIFDATNPPCNVNAIMQEFLQKNKENAEEMSIKKIKPFPRTIKKIDESDPFLAMLEDSIKENGIKLPLLVNQNDICIDGHRRLFIAKKLGLETVPTIKISTDEYTGNSIYLSM